MEEGILHKILQKLKSHVIYGHHQPNTYTHPPPSSKDKKSQMDLFEKWIGILKYPFSDSSSALKSVGKSTALRIDLIVCPISQFYYALVGWTGNKMFNRSLRLYAAAEMNMQLSSHALFNREKVNDV